MTEQKNPDREVKTIRDLIFYQYAKIIARSAFSVPDGKEAKQKQIAEDGPRRKLLVDK